jgi:uncharacterized C2H2 Zn-finger protein
MSDFDRYRALGCMIFDGKTLNKCPDCDFTTTSFHEYTTHRLKEHPPDFGPPTDEPMTPGEEEALVEALGLMCSTAGSLLDLALVARKYADAKAKKN